MNKTSKNLIIGDQSFECGLDNWYYSHTEEQPQRSEKYAHTGKYSLMTNGNSLYSRYYYKLIKAGKGYVFSFYARSEEKSEIKVQCLNSWYPLGESVFQLDKEWKRYCINIAPQGDDNNIWFVIHPQKNCNTYFDDFQLEEGTEATAYEPSQAVSVFCTTGMVSEIYVVEKDGPCTVTSTFYNAALPKNKSYTADIRIRRYPSKEDIFAINQPLEFNADGIAEIKTEMGEEALPGYYPVFIKVFDEDGGLWLEREEPFAIAAALAEDHDRDFFGMHANHVSLEALRRIGTGWIKFGVPGWASTERERGKFSGIDTPLWHPKGFKRITSIHEIAFPPAWASVTEDGLPCNGEDIADFVNYVMDTIDHDTDMYELESEADLRMGNLHNVTKPVAAASYAEMMNTVGRIIHERGNKITTDVACGGHESMTFAAEVLRLSGKNIDAFAPHLYGWSRYIGEDVAAGSPETNHFGEQICAAQQLIDKHGGNQELYIGEYGYAFDSEAACDSKYASLFAAYNTRSYLIAKSIPQMTKIVYFTAYYCVENKYDYGMWRNNNRPSAAAAAHATCARFIGGSDCVTRQNGPDIYILEFIRDGKSVFAVWNCNANEENSSTTVCVPAEGVNGYSMTGSPIKVGDNALKFELSAYPVYLEVLNENSDSFFAELSNAISVIRPYKIDAVRKSSNELSVKLTAMNTLRHSVSDKITVTVNGKSVSGECVVLPNTETEFVANFEEELPNHKLEISIYSEQMNREVMIEISTSIICEKKEIADWKNCDISDAENVIVLDSRESLVPPDPGCGWDGAEDLSAKIFTAWDNENLYIMADVTDDIHHQPYKDNMIWQGDGITIGLDCGNNGGMAGYDHDDDFDIGMALCEGGPQMWLWSAPDRILADNVKFPVDVKREGNVTKYRMAVPWKYTMCETPKAGTVVGISFLVNDDDGSGVRYTMQTDMGLSGLRRPGLFSKLLIK